MYTIFFKRTDLVVGSMREMILPGMTLRFVPTRSKF